MLFTSARRSNRTVRRSLESLEARTLCAGDTGVAAETFSYGDHHRPEIVQHGKTIARFDNGTIAVSDTSVHNDVNADGMVDLGDLVIVVGALRNQGGWGPVDPLIVNCDTDLDGFLTMQDALNVVLPIREARGWNHFGPILFDPSLFFQDPFASADLTIAVSGPDVAQQDGVATYVATVTNVGYDAAENAEVWFHFSSNNTAQERRISNLHFEPGVSQSFVVEFPLNGLAGPANLHVSASTETLDINYDNNYAYVGTYIQSPAHATVRQGVDLPETVTVGAFEQGVMDRLVIANDGDVPLTFQGFEYFVVSGSTDNVFPHVEIFAGSSDDMSFYDAALLFEGVIDYEAFWEFDPLVIEPGEEVVLELLLTNDGSAETADPTLQLRFGGMYLLDDRQRRVDQVMIDLVQGDLSILTFEHERHPVFGECTDGIDNEGDGSIDNRDRGCTDASDPIED